MQKRKIPGPRLRATVLRYVLRLAGNMRFIKLDPFDTGTYTLEGPDGHLIVMAEPAGLDRQTGYGLGGYAAKLARIAELWGWDGLRRVVSVHGGHFPSKVWQKTKPTCCGFLAPQIKSSPFKSTVR